MKHKKILEQAKTRAVPKTQLAKGHLEILFEEKDELMNIRGRVIELTLVIEGLLEHYISNVLFYGKDKTIVPNRELFTEVILENEFFTLRHKIRVFKALYILHSMPKKGNYTKFIKDLDKINSTRNKFAHGRIKFKNGKQAMLEYYSNGRKEITLNDKYLDDLDELFSKTNVMLGDVVFRTLKKLSKKISPKIK